MLKTSTAVQHIHLATHTQATDTALQRLQSPGLLKMVPRHVHAPMGTAQQAAICAPLHQSPVPDIPAPSNFRPIQPCQLHFICLQLLQPLARGIAATIGHLFGTMATGSSIAQQAMQPTWPKDKHSPIAKVRLRWSKSHHTHTGSCSPGWRHKRCKSGRKAAFAIQLHLPAPRVAALHPMHCCDSSAKAVVCASNTTTSVSMPWPCNKAVHARTEKADNPSSKAQTMHHGSAQAGVIPSMTPAVSSDSIRMQRTSPAGRLQLILNPFPVALAPTQAISA